MNQPNRQYIHMYIEFLKLNEKNAHTINSNINSQIVNRSFLKLNLKIEPNVTISISILTSNSFLFLFCFSVDFSIDPRWQRDEILIVMLRRTNRAKLLITLKMFFVVILILLKLKMYR